MSVVGPVSLDRDGDLELAVAGEGGLGRGHHGAEEPAGHLVVGMHPRGDVVDIGRLRLGGNGSKQAATYTPADPRVLDEERRLDDTLGAPCQGCGSVQGVSVGGDPGPMCRRGRGDAL